MSVLACTVALLLSLDVSGSMTNEEYQLETVGFADSLMSEEVLPTVQANYPLTIRVDQWGSEIATAIPWTLIRNDADLQEFSQRVRAMPRLNVGPGTRLGNMLKVEKDAFQVMPCSPLRKVMDVSGDGKDECDLRPLDQGEPVFCVSGVDFYRNEYPDLGITINGLPIVNPESSLDQDVVEYYQQHVVTPDGFVIQSDGFLDIIRAIRRKLVAEIS